MSNLPINQIVCDDCIEVLKGWPDGCVDLVLTDPPYGIGENAYRNNSRTKLAATRDYGDYDWDKRVSNEHIRRLVCVSKNQIVFGGNYYGSVLGDTRCYVVWDKDNSGHFADCELAWASFKSSVRLIRYRWNGMLQEPGVPKEDRQHPTQKPIGVMRWILERYSKTTDLILDPFCGSGSTCVAAKLLGRNYIGIDISEEYCEIARKRLDAVETGVPVKERDNGQMPMFP